MSVAQSVSDHPQIDSIMESLDILNRIYLMFAK